MVSPRCRPTHYALIAVAAFMFGSACGHHSPPAIDPAVASSLPAGTVAVAGLDLDTLRRSPLCPQMPAAARSAVDFVPGASRLTLAWNGKELLTLGEGDFTAAPAGFTLLTPHLAAGGSADIIRAAQAQQRTGATGAPELLARAAALASDHAVWIAAAGDAALPLSGNFANLDHLLRYSRYTTAAARVTDHVEIEAAALCAGPGQARELEEKLRALVSLLSTAAARRSDLAAIWNAVRIDTRDDSVRLSLALSPEASSKALALFAR